MLLRYLLPATLVLGVAIILIADPHRATADETAGVIRLNAADFTATGGRNTQGVHTGANGIIGDLYTHDWIRFTNVDLTGITAARVRAAVPMQRHVAFELFIDVTDERNIRTGRRIGQFQFGEQLDSGWNDLNVRETVLDVAVSGKHKLYILFSTPGDASGLGAIDWFELLTR